MPVFVITAIKFIRANRLAQFALAGAVGVIAFLIWLAVHDAGVRKAERAKMDGQTTKASQNAGKRADEAQEERDDDFKQSQANLANAVSPDDWARRLRAEQCARGKIAAPC